MTDNDLPRNSQGLSFYNNLYPQLCTDHVALSNACYQSVNAGLNIGSSVSTEFPLPTANSYVVGNIMYDNTRNAFDKDNKIIKGKTQQGLASNGPIYGIVLIGNSDSNGPNPSLYGYNQKGCLIVVDPMKRIPYPAPIALTPSAQPIVAPLIGSALNVTIINGAVNSCLGSACSQINSIASGLTLTTTSALLAFVNQYFPQLPDASQSPWAFAPTTTDIVSRKTTVQTQILNFITLVGNYDGDVPLVLPSNLMLVMNGAKIVATSAFPSSALGLIVASNAPFAGVVSPGGPDAALIDCGLVKGPSGIYIYNSAYFTVDGISVNGCGAPGAQGAISILGTTNLLAGNSTSVLNSKITNAQGYGIYASQACRPVLYKNSITGSGDSGIYVTGGSFGPIVTGNIISTNGANGVYLGNGSTMATVRGNLISQNRASGISVTNIGGYKTMNNIAIVTNTVWSNSGNSILIAVDSMSTITSTVIGGNTMFRNFNGIQAVDPDLNGIQKTILASNADLDGVMSGLVSLTNGNSAVSGGYGNYFFDPLNRGLMFVANNVVGNVPSVTVTNRPVTASA